MKVVLVTGATGFIGQKLCEGLLKSHYKLKILSRKKDVNFLKPCEVLSWDEGGRLSDVEAVLHLAGEPVAQRRWTEAQKKRILESRKASTETLIQALDTHGKSLKVFLSASATGFYESSQEPQTEASPQGTAFLSQVCGAWEAPALKMKRARTGILRLGTVLGRQGGFLKEVEPMFRWGLGGRLGSGRQWMSFVHIDDVVKTFLYVLEHERLSGVFNVTAPHPVTNLEFTQQYNRILKAGLGVNLPIPSWSLRMLLGERADLLLDSHRILPERLLKEESFSFGFPTLEKALEDLYPTLKKKRG